MRVIMFCWYEYVTYMVGTIMSWFGWCIEIYVWLYEDVCVVLVNVCICWVGTNRDTMGVLSNR